MAAVALRRRPAHPPAVQNQHIRRARPASLRHRRAQLLFDDFRIVGRRDPETVGNTQHVAIDWQAGDAEGVAEHDVCRLAPDPGQLDERVHVGRHAAAVPLNQRSHEEGSRESKPAIDARSARTSVTERASGPTVSRELLTGCTPWVETAPNVGRRPETPHSDAGSRTDPPVSVPIAATHRSAATAAPEPPLDPPGIRSGAAGLTTAPNVSFADVAPKASSWRFAVPRITPPAA